MRSLLEQGHLLGSEYWANHCGDGIFHSCNSREDWIIRKELKPISSMLEISKLLSHPALLSAEDISQLAGRKGEVYNDMKLTSTVWMCCLASSQHVEVSAPLTPVDRSCATPSSQSPPTPSYHFWAASAEAASATDSGRFSSQLRPSTRLPHVTQHQNISSSAVPVVTEIWKLSSALQIEPTLSVSQTTPVRIWRLGCSTTVDPDRSVSNGGGRGPLLGPSHFISESFLKEKKNKESFLGARSHSVCLLTTDPGRRNYKSQYLIVY